MKKVIKRILLSSIIVVGITLFSFIAILISWIPYPESPTGAPMTILGIPFLLILGSFPFGTLFSIYLVYLLLMIAEVYIRRNSVQGKKE